MRATPFRTASSHPQRTTGPADRSANATAARRRHREAIRSPDRLPTRGPLRGRTGGGTSVVASIYRFDISWLHVGAGGPRVTGRAAASRLRTEEAPVRGAWGRV